MGAKWASGCTIGVGDGDLPWNFERCGEGGSGEASEADKSASWAEAAFTLTWAEADKSASWAGAATVVWAEAEAALELPEARAL